MRKTKILHSKEGYNLAAKNYDKKEGYLNSFEKKLVLPMLGSIDGLKILDAGAGTGRLSIELARLGAFVEALDVSDSMLSVLKYKIKDKNDVKNKIKTTVGDIENIPFLDNTFDCVISAFVIVHLKDPKRFFDEVYRVLKNGGKFLITNINQKEPPDVETDEGKIKIQSYYHSPEKIKEILEELAFTIEKEIFVKEGETWINQIVVAVK